VKNTTGEKSMIIIWDLAGREIERFERE